ncbi:hypothetical protein GSI_07285 [Ganoderma sinense ZZ0214-1]|uniref:Uncharacterized protein n=1 Tax=Ganoderma sinense ZZ0214-1 TaxID=1077348 RepID=A0A2G8SA06_9APHY|nr:hypothetical protein GSI_07285 [Ganoderma sinense ZZ0214-1]
MTGRGMRAPKLATPDPHLPGLLPATHQETVEAPRVWPRRPSHAQKGRPMTISPSQRTDKPAGSPTQLDTSWPRPLRNHRPEPAQSHTSTEDAWLPGRHPGHLGRR